MYKKLLLAVAAATMMMGLTVSAEGETIGVSMPTKDLQRWVQDGENMQAQLEEKGYTVDLQYAANDVQTQVSQIENMISNGCNLLLPSRAIPLEPFLRRRKKPTSRLSLMTV